MFAICQGLKSKVTHRLTIYQLIQKRGGYYGFRKCQVVSVRWQYLCKLSTSPPLMNTTINARNGINYSISILLNGRLTGV